MHMHLWNPLREKLFQAARSFLLFPSLFSLHPWVTWIPPTHQHARPNRELALGPVFSPSGHPHPPLPSSGSTKGPNPGLSGTPPPPPGKLPPSKFTAAPFFFFSPPVHDGSSSGDVTCCPLGRPGTIRPPNPRSPVPPPPPSRLFQPRPPPFVPGGSILSLRFSRAPIPRTHQLFFFPTLSLPPPRRFFPHPLPGGPFFSSEVFPIA